MAVKGVKTSGSLFFFVLDSSLRRMDRADVSFVIRSAGGNDDLWDFGTVRNIHARPGTLRKYPQALHQPLTPTTPQRESLFNTERELPFPPPPSTSPTYRQQSHSKSSAVAQKASKYEQHPETPVGVTSRDYAAHPASIRGKHQSSGSDFETVKRGTVPPRAQSSSTLVPPSNTSTAKGIPRSTSSIVLGNPTTPQRDGTNRSTYQHHQVDSSYEYYSPTQVRQPEEDEEIYSTVRGGKGFILADREEEERRNGPENAVRDEEREEDEDDEEEVGEGTILETVLLPVLGSVRSPSLLSFLDYSMSTQTDDADSTDPQSTNERSSKKCDSETSSSNRGSGEGCPRTYERLHFRSCRFRRTRTGRLI